MSLRVYLFGLALILSSAWSVEFSDAVVLRNGKTYFNQTPQLLEAYTSQKTVNVSGAIYQFKISVPKDAGEALQKVEIKQFRPLDQVRFDLDEFQLGTAIASDSDQNITVVFNPPIRAGETIDIRLRAIRNPRYGGVYLFGVTAFPQGDDPHGQFLGYGRLHFYDAGDYR